MNSLKKIAAISAIIFAIALLLTIILTPFAVSSGIDFYNSIIDKAVEKQAEYWTEVTLDSTVTDLLLLDSGYYGRITIEESPDKQIHIWNQDIGFEYIQPEVHLSGNSAEVSFLWVNDPKLSEENILQIIAANLDNHYRQTIIQLPAHASLLLDENYLGDYYYHLDLEYNGFANYEPLRKQLDDWYAASQIEVFYNNYVSELEQLLLDIEESRLHITENLYWQTSVEQFQSEFAVQYAQIRDKRMNLLTEAYDFQSSYGNAAPETLEAAFKEYAAVIEELGAAEHQYDLLTVQRQEAESKLAEGDISEETFMKICDSSFLGQSDLEVTISKLQQKLYTYLRQDVKEEDLPAELTIKQIEPIEETEIVETTEPVTATTDESITETTEDSEN